MSKQFEGKVITHLEYIREKQAEHDKKIESMLTTFSNHKFVCSEKFEEVNKKINTAEGFAKGALFMGGTGLVSGIVGWFTRFFK